MKKLWFRAKRYGLGWYPASWEGWVVLLIWVVLYVSIFRDIDAASHSVSDTLIGVCVPFVLLTALLIFVCFITGEKPGWRWGGKD